MAEDSPPDRRGFSRVTEGRRWCLADSPLTEGVSWDILRTEVGIGEAIADRTGFPL